MIHVLAGILLMAIGISIIFTPPMIEAYRLLQIDWHKIPMVPTITILLLSQACIVMGLLLISGVFNIYFIK